MMLCIVINCIMNGLSFRRRCLRYSMFNRPGLKDRIGGWRRLQGTVGEVLLVAGFHGPYEIRCSFNGCKIWHVVEQNHSS